MSRSASRPALIGDAIRSERERTREAHEFARRIAELRDRDVERAVVEERLRIARDVHDITGHHLSAISLQAAGAGPHDVGPGRARGPRAHPPADLRGARPDAARARRPAASPSRPRRAPTPRLEHVEQLLEPARDAGLAVELRVDGAGRPLSDELEVCAYRVVQESLTNVVRHAGASAVRVRVAYGERELTIAVEDDGVGGPGAGPAAASRGCASASRSSAAASPPGRPRTAGRLGGPLDAAARWPARAGRGGAVSIRVVVADDQAIARQGLRMILESEPDIEVVGEAVDGLDALGQVERRAPDVLLIDIRMPRMDGLEATRRLRDTAGVEVIVITTFDLDEYVLEALRAGAVGFLVKDSPPDRIIDAVRAVARGDALISPEVTRRLLDQFVSAAPARAGDPALGRPDPARARRAARDRGRPQQRRHRRPPASGGEHGQEPRRPHARQARPHEPRAGRDLRLRDRARRAGRVA